MKDLNHSKIINATKVQITKPVSDTVTKLVQGSVSNDSVEDCIIKHSCKNCGTCYEGYSEDQAQKFLDTHSKKHLNKCPQCSKTFIEVSKLLNHIRIYHKQYNCDHCRFITLIKSEMIEHLALKHTEKKRFMCKGCYKQHQNLSELKRHVCTNDQTGLCQYCGYKSKNLNSLRWHVRTYHTERNFVCSICNKSMATQVGLTLHMHHHENPRPKISGYICDVCGKHFKEKSTLKMHMVTHTGEKPLKCSVCGTRFAKRETLRQHLLTHTGKRPYSCDICGKRFVQKPALTCHRKSHPGDHPPLPKVYIDSYIKEVDPSMVHDFTVPVPELKIESKTFLDFSSK